jgi:hypothetical protein
MIRVGSLGPILLVIMALLIGAATMFGLLMSMRAGNWIAEGVTSERLQRIKPGMSEDQVLQFVGRPLWEHRYYGEGAGASWVTQPNMFIWQYALPGFMNGGFAIYVRFTDRRVTDVEVKYDDFVVYTCAVDRCPDFAGSPDVLRRLPTAATGH